MEPKLPRLCKLAYRQVRSGGSHAVIAAYLSKSLTIAGCLLQSKSPDLPGRVGHSSSGFDEVGTRICLDLGHYREVQSGSSESCPYNSQVFQRAFASVRKLLISNCTSIWYNQICLKGHILGLLVTNLGFSQRTHFVVVDYREGLMEFRDLVTLFEWGKFFAGPETFFLATAKTSRTSSLSYCPYDFHEKWLASQLLRGVS